MLDVGLNEELSPRSHQPSELGQERIPDDPAQWTFEVRGATSLAEQLRAHREPLMLYRLLATLRVDVPLAETLDDLEWHGADRAALETLATELGAEELLERVPLWR